MAGWINHLLRKLLPTVFFHFVVIGLIFFSLPPALSQEGPVSMPGTPVPLILDPTISTFRVEPRTHPLVIRPMAAAIRVNYVPNGSTGYWGDLCETWPTDAQTAFSYAASLWAAYLNAAAPIDIEACWTDMGFTSILGHGGGVYSWRNFTNAPVANTWYTSALVNALSGVEQNDTYFGIPNYPEIAVAFNKNFSWYFGTNGTPGMNVDFASVVLHEICHGLGFLGSMDVSGGQGSWGWSGTPYAYDRFAVNGIGQSLINTAIFPNPSAALGTALTTNNVYFSGTNARAANGNANAKLYAPTSWNPGSSYAHLDEVFNGTPNALMTYSLSSGEADHDPGPVTLGILKDIGWSLSGVCTYSIDPQSNSFNLSGGIGSLNVVAGAGCAWTVASNDGWITVTGGSSGSGNGTVNYSVAGYTGTGSRTGTMTIGGQTFTVNQAGCTYTLNPASSPIFTAAGAAAQTFSVATDSNCPWTPAGNPSWVIVNSGTGPGSRTVNYTVAPNPGVALRSANINIGDKSFVVTQTGVLPTAIFTSDVTSGNVPFQVAFTDSSSNATSWLWEFGDGETSALENPTHTYQTTTGSPFTVRLTATNINGSDMMTQTVSASSCANGPVRYSGTSYPVDGKIGTAYSVAAMVDELDIQAIDFIIGSLTFAENKDITLRGGYDCSYSPTRIPDTVIEGSLTISGGTVTLDQIVVK